MIKINFITWRHALSPCINIFASEISIVALNASEGDKIQNYFKINLIEVK